MIGFTTTVYGLAAGLVLGALLLTDSYAKRAADAETRVQEVREQLQVAQDLEAERGAAAELQRMRDLWPEVREPSRRVCRALGVGALLPSNVRK